MIRCAAGMLMVILLAGQAFSQCPTSLQLREKLLQIESDAALPGAKKLEKVASLEKQFNTCALAKDSVYARLLHRMGVLEYTTGKLNEAILHTVASIHINTSGNKNCSRKFAVNSFYNLGIYYTGLSYYKQALNRFDSCILTGKAFDDAGTAYFIKYSRLKKANIYNNLGDYQQDIDEITLALQLVPANDPLVVDYLQERAQAYAGVKQFAKALTDLDNAHVRIGKEDYNANANNFHVRALVYEATGNYRQSLYYFNQAVAMRLKAGRPAELAGDYLNAGNFLRNHGNGVQARLYYNESLKLAWQTGDHATHAKAINNLGTLYFRAKNYSAALQQYHKALLLITVFFKNPDPLQNPAFHQCNAMGNKIFLYQVLSNKAECLLHLYKQTAEKRYLAFSLRTAFLTDSVITAIRHEQTGEQSKLYWRNDTRDFFSNAMEACYLQNNPEQAFYFMEKSKAVLLNDKLNEMGASVILPPADAATEQKLQISMISLQQQLSQLNDTAPGFNLLQLKFLEARQNLERYLHTLETKYPVYYQYKYADQVPGFTALKNYLVKNQLSFVHYFINDTAVYVLAIKPSAASIIKIPELQYNGILHQFHGLCSDIEALNRNYGRFAALSHQIYRTLFQPLQLPKGRIIISNDNALVPFEALTTDTAGTDFLVYNHIFSYVYSAGFLLKKFRNPSGEGNFLGVAPANYAAYLKVLPLTQSVASLNESAAYYHQPKLITNDTANRRNFLSLVYSYTIVNIFSHASADTSGREPLLYMADSTIRLSELQMVKNPATRLVVLSACETSVGRNATGEGIYSLARGFASAGIPSVAATLWKADESAIYFITAMFNKNIAASMRKDDALQQAKLAFMRQGNTRNLLPYYWANMILAGNGEPVSLAKNNAAVWWVIAFGLLLVAAVVYIKTSK